MERKVVFFHTVVTRIKITFCTVPRKTTKKKETQLTCTACLHTSKKIKSNEATKYHLWEGCLRKGTSSSSYSVSNLFFKLGDSGF